jgi:hypothetical protein
VRSRTARVYVTFTDARATAGGEVGGTAKPGPAGGRTSLARRRTVEYLTIADENTTGVPR